MALKDLVVEVAEVVTRTGTFSVHGLSLSVIMALMAQGHRSEIEDAVDTLRKAVGDDLENAGDMGQIVGALSSVVANMPQLCAKVIACCADEPDMWETVLKLPVSAQLDALIKIAKLTFDGEDSVKKFLLDLILMLTSLRRAATPAVQAAKEALAGMKD